MQRNVPQIDVPDVGCFGCGRSNPAGMRLRFFGGADGVTAPCRIPDRLHGAPGIAHGGIVATILDEVSCVAGFANRGVFFVTGELSVRYEQPCPIDVDLVASGHVVEVRRSYCIIEAELLQGDVVLARSTGRFFPQERTENAP